MRNTSLRFLVNFPRQFPKAQPLALAIGLALTGGLPGIAYSQTPASAEQNQLLDFDLPAAPLSQSLLQIGRIAGVVITVNTDLVKDKTAVAVKGKLTAEQALQRALTGTGLELTKGDVGYTLRQSRSTGLLPTVKIQSTQIGEKSIEGYVARYTTTATKTDTPILETPQTISVITAAHIEATGATRVKEALAYTPSVNVAPWGASHYDWIYLRGFDAYSPGFLKNGLMLLNSMGWATWMNHSYNAERIDVMRGPSSVLFGQAAAGGVVNVVSKRPQTTPGHELQVRVGNDSLRQIETDFTGPLAGSNNVQYRLVGVVKDAELQTTGLRDDEFFVAPSLAWQNDDDTKITFLSEFLRTRSGTEADSLPVVGTLLSNPNGNISPTTFKGEPDFNRYYQDQWMLGYEFEHRLNDQWSFNQNLHYGELSSDYRIVYGARFVTVDATNPDNPANFRSISRTPHHTDEEVSSLAVDNRLQGDFGWGKWQHTLLAGLDHQRSDFTIFSRYGGRLAPLDLYAPVYGSPITLAAPHLNADLTLTQTGLYLQDQIKFDERWVLTLGGRHDNVKLETNDHLSSSITEQKDDAFTGRVGLVYLSSIDVAPYVSYSESFSPVTTINPETGKPFDPEEGRQYEVGVRYQPDGTSNTFSMAAFETRRTNYVTYGYSTGLPVAQARGELTVQGMEVEAIFKPTTQTNTIFSYTWIPQADVTASANIDDIDKQLNAVSEHQLSLWNDYRFTNGFKVGAGIRFIGSNKGTQEIAPRKVEGYAKGDLMLGYDTAEWEFVINLRNIGSNNDLATCDASQCFYAPLKTLTATASYRW